MSETTNSISVALYLRGSKLDPKAVSAALGMQPDRSQYNGEHQHGAQGRVFMRNVGLWSLEAKLDPASDNLSDYIDTLLSKINFDHQTIKKLSGLEEAYVDIFVAKDADDGGGTSELEISPTQLKRLSQLGVSVKFTVAIVSAE